MADIADIMVEDSFFHPYHALLSPTSTTISLPSFYAPLPVFPSHLSCIFCTPMPVFLHPLTCLFTALCLSFYSPCLLFTPPCLSLPTSFGLPPSTLSLVSLLPLVCTSWTHFPAFHCTHDCLFCTLLPVFLHPFCLFLSSTLAVIIQPLVCLFTPLAFHFTPLFSCFFATPFLLPVFLYSLPFACLFSPYCLCAACGW